MTPESEIYYQIIFNNGREFFVNSEFPSAELFIYNVYETQKVEGFITLQSEARTPMFIRKEEIFSIQEVSKEVIGGSTRKWRLV